MASDIPYSYPLRGAGSDSLDEAKAELEILRELAAGRNPMTGESLPDDSCYQSAKVLRALLSAIKVLEKAPRQRALPQKAGQAWSAEEDVECGKCFEQGMTISEMALKHKRTEGAIRSRLEKLGKIAPSYIAAEASTTESSFEQK
jgi:hypothetical protein